MLKPSELQPFSWCPQCESHYTSTLIDCPLCVDKEARKPSPTPYAAATFAEALRLIGGDRRADYGDVRTSFKRIAQAWSAVLGMEVTAQQVCLCMIGLKMCREANGHKADSVADMCGYAGLLSELEGGK